MTRRLTTTLSLIFALAFFVAACAAPAGPGLSLGEAPWQDGETVKYDLIDKSGNKVGSEEIGYVRAGGDWQISILDKASSFEQSMKVRVDATTLKPVGAEKSIKAPNSDVSINTTYQGGKLNITAVVNGENRSASIDVPSDALDNDQLLVTLRALKFADGYVGKYVNVVASNASKINTTIRVMAKENVEVPAGTYEAWKVELDFNSAKQYAWYQVAGPTQLVQYDNGSTKMVLTK